MTDDTAPTVTLTIDADTGATLVTHDFPDDVPVAVIADASAEKPPVEGFTDALRDEALQLLAGGEAAKAMLVVAEAQRLDQLPSVIEVRPLTDDELAQKTERADGAAARQDELAKAAAANDALVEKLAAGTASPAEIQSALARLLGE